MPVDLDTPAANDNAYPQQEPQVLKGTGTDGPVVEGGTGSEPPRASASSGSGGSGRGEPPVTKPPAAAGKPTEAPREPTFDEKWEQMERALKEQEAGQEPAAEGEGLERAVEPEAQKIADGHAWEDHHGEFPEFKSQDEFAEHVDRVMSEPTATKTSGDRTAYWDEQSGTIVIKDPKHPDGGTAFRPARGRDYFDDWPNVKPPKE